MLLRLAITALALASGVLHFALDVVLFRSNFGFFRLREAGPPPGPPPGASGPPLGTPPPQLPLPLPQLFFLNFVGWMVLLALYWLAPRWLGRWSWLVSAAMLVYTILIIAGWAYIGSPNPMNLGYASKVIEVILLVLLAVDLARAWRGRSIPIV
jgi:hypothetical protein